MREIKFRAWDNKRNKMLYPIFDNIGTDLETWVDCEFEIMQLTGLKDKNGKEIFEGDIVVCRSMHDSNVFDHIWEQQKTGQAKPIPQIIERDGMGVDWNWPSDIRENPGYWEIIGNVFENPELVR